LSIDLYPGVGYRLVTLGRAGDVVTAGLESGKFEFPLSIRFDRESLRGQEAAGERTECFRDCLVLFVDNLAL
jgi:hypothetical protein